MAGDVVRLASGQLVGGETEQSSPTVDAGAAGTETDGALTAAERDTLRQTLAASPTSAVRMTPEASRTSWM
jgi:hypothetical protein